MGFNDQIDSNFEQNGTFTVFNVLIYFS